MMEGTSTNAEEHRQSVNDCTLDNHFYLLYDYNICGRIPSAF